MAGRNVQATPASTRRGSVKRGSVKVADQFSVAARTGRRFAFRPAAIVGDINESQAAINALLASFN